MTERSRGRRTPEEDLVELFVPQVLPAALVARAARFARLALGAGAGRGTGRPQSRSSDRRPAALAGRRGALDGRRRRDGRRAEALRGPERGGVGGRCGGVGGCGGLFDDWGWAGAGQRALLAAVEEGGGARDGGARREEERDMATLRELVRGRGSAVCGVDRYAEQRHGSAKREEGKGTSVSASASGSTACRDRCARQRR